MISPHTPSGTKIVCIDAGAHTKYNTMPSPHPSGQWAYCLDGLLEGEIYTVSRIVEGLDGLSVEIAEIRRPHRAVWGLPEGFALGRFRRAELPSCLTDILNGAPIDELERTP